MSAPAKRASKSATRLRAAGPLAGDGMTPFLPPEGRRQLDELVFTLTREASAFAGQVHPQNQLLIGGMVRSMNCYYSNLIEGHHTHPRDIDAALGREYARQPEKRNLQKEAAAHIAVQELIDTGQAPAGEPASGEYARWLHREFCQRLPEELLWVENPDTHERKAVRPGELRDGGVAVGQHIPPPAAELEGYLRRFGEVYRREVLAPSRYVAALGAAHHRFAWIHPFYDGNGRLGRLLSHAMLRHCGLGSSMWSVARGLARSVEQYKELLAAADQGRYTDTDGRGVLSERALVRFCEYFLETAIDQVRFMARLIEPRGLLARLEKWCAGQESAKRIEKRSYLLLREIWHEGAAERGAVAGMVNVSERQGREMVSRLVAEGVLVSDTPRGPLRLHCPIGVVEEWFPGVYPRFDRMPETGANIAAATVIMEFHPKNIRKQSTL